MIPGVVVAVVLVVVVVATTVAAAALLKKLFTGKVYPKMQQGQQTCQPSLQKNPTCQI